MNFHRPLLALALGATLGLGLAAPAHAAALLDATQPDQLVEIARHVGTARQSTDSFGDPQIAGQIDGVKYTITFLECGDDHHCRTLLFTSTWSAADSEGIDARAMQAWNAQTRFGKAYVDGQDRPTIELAVDMSHGVAPGTVSDTFSYWRSVLKSFKKHLEDTRGTQRDSDD